MFHYHIASWHEMGRNSIHLFGHCHSKYEGRGKSIDVGIDNYYKLFGCYSPFLYEEIIKIIDK